jgi:CheY-like chemotaxis protein
LNQRGHAVDIAQDGQQALAALRHTSYDVALIDFHLPELDGLQVAKRYRGENKGDGQARLIAITADIEGLLSHSENCENFDQIIPKPLDIFDICNVIEQAASRAPLAKGETPGLNGEEPPPAARSLPRHAGGHAAARPRPADPSWALGLEWLRWPDDFQGKNLAAYGAKEFDGADSIDGIIVREAADPARLAPIWLHKPLHLFPIIDLTGSLGPQADLNASAESQGVRDAVRQLVQSFHQRRAQLHRDLLTASDPGEKLLSRLFVQNAPLTAAYDAGNRSLIRYNVPLDAADAIREAEALCRQGFLSRDFFERFHLCYRCSSARLLAREECPKCQSSNLRDEQYVHHYKCAYQGVESDFRQGDRLVCPKCRQELTHFSVDYDKPGSMVACGRCGHAGSEPAVGFVCLDCSIRMDGDAAQVRDVYSYALTKEGSAFAQAGYAMAGAGQRTIRFADLPLEFVIALNAAAKAYNERQTPFTAVSLFYENEREIVREAGMRQFAQARDLFLENLRSALGGRAAVVKGHAYDFCLLKGVKPDQADEMVSEIHEAAAGNLTLDLGVKAQLFGPEDFV